MDTFFSPYIVALLTQIPLFIIYIIGVIVALSQRKNHPRASLFTILAMVGLFFSSLVLVGVQIGLPHYLASNTSPTMDIRLVLGIVSGLRNLIDAIAIGLLLIAVYNRRISQTQQRQL
jgi:hypothetical protein